MWIAQTAGGWLISSHLENAVTAHCRVILRGQCNGLKPEPKSRMCEQCVRVGERPIRSEAAVKPSWTGIE